MPPRIIATGLGGAAIYAGVLGAPAAAQSPPAATPAATATPSPAAIAAPGVNGASSAGSLPGATPRATATPRAGNVAVGRGVVAPPPPPVAVPRSVPAPPPAAAAAPVAAAPAWAPIAAHVDVPASSIADFRIPPFLLPIYQAAAGQYGVPWEILAAINEIETGYGRDLRVSPAGARGWMQFMPATWRRYGVDANGDGRRDPWNPVDAIFGAARYLRAAGAATDLRGAVLAYNHAGWYADAVLARARVIGGLPGGLVDSLAGLASDRFPVRGPSSYGGAGQRWVSIAARASAAVVAVADGRVVRRGRNRLGRFVVLRDLDGNTFTYSGLASFSRRYRVAAGATIAHLGEGTPRLRFAIRPAGQGAPLVDPRPILDGWRLLAAASGGRRPFAVVGTPSVGQLLLTPRGELIRRVLASPRLDIYACGREDVRAGRIDRRVLVAMLDLADSGLRLRISSLECGHSLLTTSGNVSEHSTGTAMDIAAVNGISITPATQGPGTITETTIRRLLALHGVMAPHQIISLMTFAGAANTLSLPDHADHIHVGWRPFAGSVTVPAALRPGQWTKLTDRLEAIGNPVVTDR
jgi:soluble lytic murein transglycosylase-like protein